jgi:glycosyltransferase involved in cell wall biosynthesis
MTDRIPRLSIGMPVYNGEEFVAEAIEALLAQSFGDFELIISDNASTDRTQEICESLARRDSRIRYVRAKENCGASPNYNRVVELARGEYFKWAAHDDLCAPDFLERCVAVLDRHPEVAWCGSQARVIDSRGRQVEAAPRSMLAAPSSRVPNDRRAARVADRFRSILLGPNWCLDLYAVVRTAALRKTRMMQPVYGIEKVIIAELSLLGQYEEIDEPLFFVRIHSNSSGALLSTTEQQSFYNPRKVRRFDFPRLRLFWGFLTAPLRTPLSLRERIDCELSVGRYLMQVNKWKRVLVSIYRRTGTGGGNLILQSSEAADRVASDSPIKASISSPLPQRKAAIPPALPMTVVNKGRNVPPRETSHASSDVPTTAGSVSENE